MNNIEKPTEQFNALERRLYRIPGIKAAFSLAAGFSAWGIILTCYSATPTEAGDPSLIHLGLLLGCMLGYEGFKTMSERSKAFKQQPVRSTPYHGPR